MDAALKLDVGRIRDLIVRTYHPEKIILYGSAASGAARADSDIDLLIVKETSEPYFERVLKVQRALAAERTTDIIVLTPREYDTAIAENRYFLVKEILPKGETIYERSRTPRRRSRVAPARTG